MQKQKYMEHYSTQQQNYGPGVLLQNKNHKFQLKKLA